MTTRDDDPPRDPDAEPARDAWLSAALRHAPDADAAPPAELSAQILRAARNAVKTAQTAQTAPRANPLMQWWSWLARPPIAAGFATVMAATVVGLMWWDRPLDEALPQRAATSVATSPAAPSAPAAAAPVAKPSQNEAAKAITPAENAAKPARAPERAAKREIAPDADAAGPADAARARAATSAPSPAAADTAAAAAPATAAAPAPRLVPAPAAAQALRRQGAVVAAPLADALAANALEHWTWQRGAAPQPMTPALQRWLAQLERAARWAPATSAPPDDAERLRLARDGAPNATIALGTDAVWLLRDGAPPLAAPLAPEAGAALRSALDAATR